MALWRTCTKSKKCTNWQKAHNYTEKFFFVLLFLAVLTKNITVQILTGAMLFIYFVIYVNWSHIHASHSTIFPSKSDLMD